MFSFRNEPLLNFSDEAARTAMKGALDFVHGQLGGTYPLLIGGQSVFTDAVIRSVNPGDPEQVVGAVGKANVELAHQAIEEAWRAFPGWSAFRPEARADCLFKAGARLRRRRLEFAAWMVYEVGKNWVEADADVAEAIDFLEYYGREMLRLAVPTPLVQIPGESNRLSYVPLGVGVIIPPWNFPLAILCGMTVSAIVTGNTVVLKPASTAPVVAAKFVELLREAGVPDGVVNYVAGSGGEIGDALVSHPRTRFVSFTGSRDVGVHIYQLAAQVGPGQIWLKRVVAEMGGKDAVLVDETADVEAAADGIVTSAYGYQGQKCSAGSRAIVVGEVYDRVVNAVLERVDRLSVGPAEINALVGPVIDAAACEKILHYIDIGQREAKLVRGGHRLDRKGWFIEPTVFTDTPPTARVALEEIFGPVLSLIRVDSFEEGVKVFNATEYGLTGSLYSSRRDRLEHGRQFMHCGNLYLNRKCTGALVGVQPFGGFNMSGTDSKAGGCDYLPLFMQAKITTERF